MSDRGKKSDGDSGAREAMPPVRVAYYDAAGVQAGYVSVDPQLLGGWIRRRLMFDAAVRHEANQRQGTHKVKTRSEVAGHHTKLFKQKGTGRARQGTKQAPHRRGGGVVHGPVPRSYRQEMNRKARRLARLSALLTKLADGEAAVIERLEFAKPRTRELAALLTATHGLGKGGAGSCLVVSDAPATGGGAPRELVLSARNIPKVKVTPFIEASAHDLLHHRRLLITRRALEAIVGPLAVETGA